MARPWRQPPSRNRSAISTPDPVRGRPSPRGGGRPRRASHRTRARRRLRWQISAANSPVSGRRSGAAMIAQRSAPRRERHTSDMNSSTVNRDWAMIDLTVPGGTSRAPWTGTMTLEPVAPGLPRTWWLPLTRSTSKPARSSARTICLPVRPVSFRCATLGSASDGQRSDQGRDIGGNLFPVVPSNRKCKLDGIAGHAERLGLVGAVGHHLRQGRNEHGEPTLRLRAEVDRELNLVAHRSNPRPRYGVNITRTAAMGNLKG